jgi:hypothetical protein
MTFLGGQVYYVVTSLRSYRKRLEMTMRLSGAGFIIT